MATSPLPVPEVGQYLKVFLPGESPWAECVAVHSDGTWEGRIDNRLVGGLHDFQQGQMVRFKEESGSDPMGGRYWIWTPCQPS